MPLSPALARTPTAGAHPPPRSQGLYVRQMAPDGTALEFTPTFLCASQVRCWK
jgi:hypothetical protein